MLLIDDPAPTITFIKEKFAIKPTFVFKYSEIFTIDRFTIKPTTVSDTYKTIIRIKSFLKIFLIADIKDKFRDSIVCVKNLFTNRIKMNKGISPINSVMILALNKTSASNGPTTINIEYDNS
jgi:hypothetical protein